MDYVIATSRSWNEVLARRLEESTGHNFHLITCKDSLTLEHLNSIKPRYVFFPHWSYLIGSEIYEAYECVIFHMTDLPYGRGGSPLQNLIIRGHKKTAMSALRCSDILDGGPIYKKQELSLEGSAAEIFIRAAGVIQSMIECIIEEEPHPKPQDEDPVFFERRRPDQSNLATAPVRSLNEFFDFIRMLDADGYPRAFVDLHDHRIEFSHVELKEDRLEGRFVLHRPDFEECRPGTASRDKSF